MMAHIHVSVFTNKIVFEGSRHGSVDKHLPFNTEDPSLDSKQTNKTCVGVVAYLYITSPLPPAPSCLSRLANQ